jgi:type I site-specific restriction-modification system R (restriction) subunit
VARLNPALPPEPQADAVRRLIQSELPNLLEENRRLHRLLTEGADVEYYADDGTLTAGKVRLLDFEQYRQQRLAGRAAVCGGGGPGQSAGRTWWSS